MFFTILLVFFSLILLIVLHELGHFLVAKRFGVKVEEFGIFLPPRLFSKQIGETVYSINLIPFGAFVRVHGEEGGVENVRSFVGKPIWQRALILLGGVIAFWIIAAILLSIVMGLGAPTAVTDKENGDLRDVKVQILQVASDSPADIAGIKMGDVVKGFEKVSEFQEFAEYHKGEEVVLTIERGNDIFDVSLIPRESPPEGEGAMGVALARTALKSYPWYQAPLKGIEMTLKMTWTIVLTLVEVLTSLISGKGLPPGAEFVGPVGIGAIMTQFAQMGVSYYLNFVAVISIYLAIFNILPIPALDGGKLLFLGIEAVRKRPVSQKIEQKLTAFFFMLLIVLIFWVTVRDIIGFF